MTRYQRDGRIHGVKEMDTAQVGSNEQTANSAYENAFVSPSDSIPLPRIKTLRALVNYCSKT